MHRRFWTDSTSVSSLPSLVVTCNQPSDGCQHNLPLRFESIGNTIPRHSGLWLPPGTFYIEPQLAGFVCSVISPLDGVFTVEDVGLIPGTTTECEHLTSYGVDPFVFRGYCPREVMWHRHVQTKIQPCPDTLGTVATITEYCHCHACSLFREKLQTSTFSGMPF